MDFDDDFDDSFDQFLLDDNNGLFKKVDKPSDRSKSPELSPEITPRNTPKTTPRKKAVDDCLVDLIDLTFSDFSVLKDSPIPSKLPRSPSPASSSSSVIFLDEPTVLTQVSNRLPPPPLLSATPSRALKAKSRLIPGSTKKSHKLPGRKTAPKPLPLQQKQPEVAPKPTAIQQKDAVKHTVVQMSNHVYDLLKDELDKMDPERRFNYTQFQQAESDIFFCPYLYWKPMPRLKEMLDSGQYVTNYNAPNFNQIMVFLSPQILHRNVHVYVKKELSQEVFESEDSFVDILDVIKKISADLNGTTQVSLVIHGLDDYLKQARNKANRQFRRQMNQMMNQEGPRRKKNTVDDDEMDGMIELTIENIDMFLIDLSMRFLHEFGGMGSANFTPIIADSLGEIVDQIFRYTRSLSEQLFRNDRRGDAGSEIYMVKSKIAAMELEESRGRADVEKIWLKQLQQMPSMKAATSKAIVEHFPTPFSLWSRLQNSTNPVGLLSKIGQGTAGRVGVDLAEKIHLFVTGDRPDEVLKTATSART